jgi:iron-sulfur cluster assembly protein
MKNDIPPALNRCEMENAMGRFVVMTMTDAAADRVREIVDARDGARGIRVGIKKGGCAGMEYTIDLVTEPSAKDDHIARDGANVWVAPEAALYLLGTEMDFERTTLRTGFTFHNPNQSSACGCGESVELKPADLKALAEARAGAA